LIAKPAIGIGRGAGVRPRNNGAVITENVVAQQLAYPLIAMQAFLTGKRGGLLLRGIGAALG
jgi:hypothetical protein